MRLRSCVAYCAATAGTLLAAAPATHAAVAEHAYVLAGLVDAVRVPQLDTQRVALMALCGLVPAGAGQKSARLMWGGKSNSEVRKSRLVVYSRCHCLCCVGVLSVHVTFHSNAAQ